MREVRCRQSYPYPNVERLFPKDIRPCKESESNPGLMLPEMGFPTDPTLLVVLEVQHEDFPIDHTSQYYLCPNTLNYGVLMGSDALVLI
ncbi:hypothetical protein Tco_0136426 [Tanacetum coccineum]